MVDARSCGTNAKISRRQAGYFERKLIFLDFELVFEVIKPRIQA